jgi:threonine dehydrogenase-like Zn-dependent dehydrogenase
VDSSHNGDTQPNLQICFPAPWQVSLVEGPTPGPAEGEVLLETRCTLISTGSELTILSGEGWSPLANGQGVPALGYSHVGTVIDVGPGVDRSWIGRRVASRSFHARYATCAVKPTPGRWRSGAFVVPDAVSDEQASLLALGLTALQGVYTGHLKHGEAVAVIGLGLLGQLVARGALRTGARRVVAISRDAGRHAFLPHHADVRALAGGAAAANAVLAESIDLAFEVSGDPAAVAPALRIVRPGGRLVLMGSARSDSTLDLNTLCVATGRSILGAHIEFLPALPTADDPWCAAEAARAFFDPAEPGLLAGPGLITHRFPATEASHAYAHLRTRGETALGCLLDWTATRA